MKSKRVDSALSERDQIQKELVALYHRAKYAGIPIGVVLGFKPPYDGPTKMGDHITPESNLKALIMMNMGVILSSVVIQTISAFHPAAMGILRKFERDNGAEEFNRLYDKGYRDSITGKLGNLNIPQEFGFAPEDSVTATDDASPDKATEQLRFKLFFDLDVAATALGLLADWNTADREWRIVDSTEETE